jgi:predicted HicB family RNase H-like nuclease
MPKKAKVGRPKMPKGQAKGRIVPVRFTPEAIKDVEVAAKAKGQTVSDWIRGTLEAALHT